MTEIRLRGIAVLTFLVWPGNTFTVFLMVAIVITSSVPELIARQGQQTPYCAPTRERYGCRALYPKCATTASRR